MKKKKNEYKPAFHQNAADFLLKKKKMKKKENVLPT